MVEATHTVIAIKEEDSALQDAAILGELRPGMETIAWCYNAPDAEIVRRAFQERNTEKLYYVINRVVEKNK